MQPIQPSFRKTLHLITERAAKDDISLSGATASAEKTAMRSRCIDENRDTRIIAIRHRRGKVTQPQIIGAAIDMRKKCFSSSSPNLPR